MQHQALTAVESPSCQTLGFTVSAESLQLIESRLARLRVEHESRLLFLGREPLDKFNPTRRATFGESISAYVQAAGAELSNYVGLIRGEVLSLVDQLLLPLSTEAIAAVMAIVERQFDPDLYPKRLTLFEDALVRTGDRYGVNVREWGMRTDISASLHHAGTHNLIRCSLAALRDDLELVRLRSHADKAAAAADPETTLEQANRLVKLEPNVFGIGINFNYLIRRLLGRKE